MGLIKNINEFIKERGLNKLEKNLKLLHTRNNLSFNPFSVSQTLNLLNDKTYSQRLLENYAWFSGSIPLLLSYYYYNKHRYTQFSNDDFKYFWGNVPIENRRVHTKIPNLISNKMVDLLVGNGVEISTEYFDENGDLDETKTVYAQEILDEILKENNFYKLLTYSIAGESWSGDIAWKIIIDTEFSRLPIIQVVDARNYEVLTKYGREVAIVFKEWFEKDKNKYELNEIYSTNENGDATIEYRLYEILTNEKKEVPLSTIEETREIEENLYVFNGLKGMLAFHKPNRLPNSEFSGTPYGESDYAGCYSLFDSLDEVYSTMIDDVRKGRTIRFIPETLLPKDNEGNTMKFNDFQLNYMKVSGVDAANDNGANQIETSTPQSKTLDYIEQWKTILITALNSAGLSPLTIGVTGLESIVASAESQQEREKTSLRTRASKIKLWSEFLEKVALQLLKTYDYIEMEEKEVPEGLESIGDIDVSNTNIKISFGDYSIRPFEDRLSIYGTALQGGSISIEEAVEQIYRDTKTDEQKKQEIDRIKMEKGISIDNIDNMLL